jgi:hypothetical protein
MFLLNKFSTLVLFDTDASHSFISRAFVVKNKTPTETIGFPIRVSSPGEELIKLENTSFRLTSLS